MEYLKDQSIDDENRCEFTFVINKDQAFKIYVSKITNSIEIITFTPDLEPHPNMSEGDAIKYSQNHPKLKASFSPEYESESVKIVFTDKK